MDATTNKPFTLRLPADLYEPIAEMAQRERRSLHNQVLYLLDRALESIEDADDRAFAEDYAARKSAGHLTADERETVPLTQVIGEFEPGRAAGRAA